MLNLEKIKDIVNSENIIFYKKDCPFCVASEILMKELVKMGVILDYKVYFLDEDFDNLTLKNLLSTFDWKSESHQNFPSKPQIFLNIEKTTYCIGGNKEFYNSKWNTGENNSNKIKIDNKEYLTPNLKNPMRF